MTLALAAPALGAPIVFAPAPTSPETVADEPYGLASADFNGDGNVDLASSHFLVGSVSVLLGDGTGNFQQPATSPEPTSNFLLELKSADFNSDGNPDLVGLGGGSSSVVILIGDGSGNFTEPPTSPEVASSAPLTAVVTGVAPGEFTGDNNQDLAVVSAFADEVTILEGSGDGNFTIDQSFGVVADPSDVLAADIAGSAALDLVVPSLNALTTTVLIGDGSGGFTEPATSPEATGQGDSKLAAGDLDEDGDNDIVVANLNAASDVLLNQGSGNFTAGTTVPGSASSADLADFDDDGHLDLARGNFTTGGANVSVGDGHGAFAAPVATAVVTTPIFVQDVNVNDFDNDGSPDLAIPASSVDQVHVFLNGTPFRRTVSVTSAGNGSGRVTSAPVGIDCPGDCSERYAEGTQVTLTAAPNAGSEFSGFSGGGCSGSDNDLPDHARQQTGQGPGDVYRAAGPARPARGRPPGNHDHAGAPQPAAEADAALLRVGGRRDLHLLGRQRDARTMHLAGDLPRPQAWSAHLCRCGFAGREDRPEPGGRRVQGEAKAPLGHAE